MKKSMFSLAIAALIVLPMQGAVTTPDNKQVRNELSSYFGRIAENSPTVLGGLAKSPDTMQAIQRHIASMSDAELSRFGAMMAQSPDWKVAPEALAAAFPPEMLDHIKRVGANHTANVPNGEAMRDDVLSLVAVLKVLPDDKLKELGVDRTLVGSLDQTFHQMSPMEAAMLQQHASQTSPWDAAGSAAVAALPGAMRRGAVALAEHGPITPADINDLEAFRNEVMALLRRIDRLPEETRQSLQTEKVRNQVQQIALATPDTVFMLRHNLPPEMLVSLEKNVEFLEGIANMSDSEKQELEQFRGELSSVFDDLGSGDGPTASEQLSSLRPEHLALLKQGMSQAGQWQTALPAIYRALASPDLRSRLQSVQGENADVHAVAAAEDFREQMLALIDREGSTSGLDADTQKRSRRAVEAASPARLEIIRAAIANLPDGASTKARLSVALNVDLGSCVIDLPDPLPDVNLSFICDPIETAINSIVTAVTNVVNSAKTALEGVINTVKSALETALNAVVSTVNNLINGIESLATDIWDFIQTIPDLAWNAIKSALNLLLDIEISNGITVRDLVARGVEHALTSMKTALGLAEGWWQAVSSFTLPMIPCPPSGFHTPFGDVGTGDAADNYGRYKLIIDNIIDMIPDTETSLAVKIPAQVLYMAFDFLGLCLEQAAAETSQNLASSRHDIVIGNFSTLSTFIGNQVFAFTQHTNSQTGFILNQVDSESSSINSTLSNHSIIIQNLLNATSSANQASLSEEAAQIRALLQSTSGDTQADIADFRALNLRTIIERSLQVGGIGMPIASLQLLEPYGYLGVVRDIVQKTIENMSAAGQGVGQAQQFFNDAVALMNGGKEKAAFNEFAKAYHQATR